MSESAGGASHPYSPMSVSGSVPSQSTSMERSVAMYPYVIGVSLMRSHTPTALASTRSCSLVSLKSAEPSVDSSKPTVRGSSSGRFVRTVLEMARMEWKGGHTDELSSHTWRQSMRPPSSCRSIFASRSHALRLTTKAISSIRQRSTATSSRSAGATQAAIERHVVMTVCQAQRASHHRS
jgi:hypothetical protein